MTIIIKTQTGKKRSKTVENFRVVFLMQCKSQQVLDL